MRSSDVFIILGGGTNGTLKPVLYTKERIEAFLKLHKHLSKPVIVTGAYSAWLERKPAYTEAQVMKNYLINYGIPAGQIFLESKSKDTAGNAYFSKQIAKKNKWKNIVVITTKGHTGRASWIFRKVFGRKYNISTMGVPTKLQTFSKNSGRRKYEDYMLGIYKNGLKSCKDGDDQKIMKVLKEFHPVYSKSKKAAEVLRQIIDTKQNLLGHTKLK